MTTFALNNSKDAVMLLTGIDMEAMPAANSVLPCSYTRDGVICGVFFSNPQYIGEMVTIITGTICATFVLYLCFTRSILTDVINLFTVNIFGPMLLLLLFQALDLIQLYFADYGITYGPLMTMTACCLMLFGTVNSVNFRALSILLLLSIYCSYSHPITHAKYFNFR
uniref:G_PROTEIN_RECEP_F1_2 domain-containing protein n=1 Tax=Ascaris lumbricoides TaxID=6252 RepID=A0A0M3IFT1_ASCLU